MVRTERSIADYDALFDPIRAAREAKSGKQLGDPQKAAPCGGTYADFGKPTYAVTSVVGGSLLHIKLQETVYHPGHYRVALAVNAMNELPVDPKAETMHEPLGHAKESKLPLLITMAEFDPVAIAPDSMELAGAVCLRDGKCPDFLYLSGHNHISETASIDTKDDRLGRAIVEFVNSVARK